MIEFLSPVSKQVVAHREILPVGVFGKQILLHKDAGDLPDLKDVKFALLGIRENRNDVDYIGGEISFDPIRKALYSLYPGNWKHSIVDIGDIEKGATIEDTYFAVKTVVSALLKKNIIPLIMGGCQDLVHAQYRGYDELGNMVQYHIEEKMPLISLCLKEQKLLRLGEESLLKLFKRTIGAAQKKAAKNSIIIF